MTLHIERIINSDGSTTLQVVTSEGDIIENVVAVTGLRTANNRFAQTMITISNATDNCVMLGSQESQIQKIPSQFVMGTSKILEKPDYRRIQNTPIPRIFSFLTNPPVEPTSSDPLAEYLLAPADTVLDENSNPVLIVAGYRYHIDNINGFNAAVDIVERMPTSQNPIPTIF